MFIGILALEIHVDLAEPLPQALGKDILKVGSLYQSQIVWQKRANNSTK